LHYKNIALLASTVTSPKVPVGMATTTTADEMPEIQLQREDERKDESKRGNNSPLLRFYV